MTKHDKKEWKKVKQSRQGKWWNFSVELDWDIPVKPLWRKKLNDDTEQQLE